MLSALPRSPIPIAPRALLPSPASACAGAPPVLPPVFLSPGPALRLRAAVASPPPLSLLSRRHLLSPASAAALCSTSAVATAVPGWWTRRGRIRRWRPRPGQDLAVAVLGRVVSSNRGALPPWTSPGGCVATHCASALPPRRPSPPPPPFPLFKTIFLAFYSRMRGFNIVYCFFYGRRRLQRPHAQGRAPYLAVAGRPKGQA